MGNFRKKISINKREVRRSSPHFGSVDGAHMCSSGPFVHVCIYINIVDLITIGRIEKIQNQKMCEKGVGDSQGIAKNDENMWLD